MAIDLVARLTLDDQLTKRMGKVTKGVMVGAAAITAGIGASVNKFVEFDNALRKAGAIAGASATEFDLLKKAALDLGASTSKSATEIADSYAEMAAKGFTATEIIAAMPGIVSASEASAESLAIAADTVSTALNIWGLEAKESAHVADVLAMAANVSAAGIGDLQQAFKSAGAPAAALGISMEEVSAAIGIMMDAGIEGSSAGVALRASLVALNNPVKAQAKMMDKLGITVRDSAGEAKSLSEIVGEVASATEHMTAADRVATVAKLVGTEAVSGFLNLIAKGPEAMDEMTAALVNSDGAAKATADAMQAGIGGALERLGGTIETFVLTVGGAFEGVVKSMSTWLSEIDTAPFTAKLEKAVKKVVAFGKSTFEALKPMKDFLLGIGKVALVFGAVIATIAVSISAFAAIGTAIAFLISPIGLIALGITALVLGFQAAYKHSEPFRKAVDNIAGAFKGLFKILSGNSQGGSDIMRAAGLDLTQIRGIYDFSKKVREGFDKVSNTVRGFASLMSGKKVMGVHFLTNAGFDTTTISKVMEFFTIIKTKAGEFVTFLAQKWEVIKPSIMSLITSFMGLKDTAISIFTTLWSVLSPIFSAVMNAFMIVADIAVMAFRNMVVPVIKYMISVFQMWWKIIGPILKLVGSAIGLAFGILKVMWDTVLAPVANFLTTIFKKSLESLNPVIEGVGKMFEFLGGIIETIAGFFDTFTSALSKFKVPNWLSKLGGGGTVNFTETTTEKKGKSNYHGIDYVAKNNSPMDLHRGEAVLTAAENKERKQGGSSGPVINIANMTVRKERDIDDIAEQLYRKWAAAAEGGA